MVKPTNYLAFDLLAKKFYAINLRCMGFFSFYVYLIGDLYEQHEKYRLSFFTEEDAMEWIEDQVGQEVPLWSFPSGLISRPQNILTNYRLVVMKGTLDKYTGKAILEDGWEAWIGEHRIGE